MSAMAAMVDQLLIIDTDAGVDDAFAIAMALKLSSKYQYKVELITTVFGNCDLDQVVKNVSKTRAACGLNSDCGPRIAKGCNDPIVKESKIDAAYFHGMDGLGNNSLPDEVSGVDANAKCAAEQIIDVCTSAKEKGVKVTFVALGPMTNLATAMSMKEDLVLSMDTLVIMGGCGNAHGNVGRTSEFNVVADAEAAEAVFANLIKNDRMATVVSWELTLATTIPWPTFDSFHSDEMMGRSRLNEFLSKISQFSYAPAKRFPIPHFSLPGEHYHGAVVCDALALAIALDPTSLIVSAHDVNMEVECKGSITRGQTVVDWGCFDGIIRPKNCKWVMEVNSDKFIEMFKAMYD